MYPWDVWFDGQIRALKRGSDFTTTLHAMEVYIRRIASARGFKVSLSIDSAAKTITIIPKPPANGSSVK